MSYIRQAIAQAVELCIIVVCKAWPSQETFQFRPLDDRLTYTQIYEYGCAFHILLISSNRMRILYAAFSMIFVENAAYKSRTYYSCSATKMKVVSGERTVYKLSTTGDWMSTHGNFHWIMNVLFNKIVHLQYEQVYVNNSRHLIWSWIHFVMRSSVSSVKQEAKLLLSLLCWLSPTICSEHQHSGLLPVPSLSAAKAGQEM